MNIHIIYWSGTGNTQTMAELIAEGAQAAGAETVVQSVSDIAPEAALACDALALGCPSMGDEVLEEGEFEPFVAAIEGKLAGKKLALFGSYGWGDGQWMRDWTERMENAKAELVQESLIVNDAPQGDDTAKCQAFGKALVC